MRREVESLAIRTTPWPPDASLKELYHCSPLASFGGPKHALCHLQLIVHVRAATLIRTGSSGSVNEPRFWLCLHAAAAPMPLRVAGDGHGGGWIVPVADRYTRGEGLVDRRRVRPLKTWVWSPAVNATALLARLHVL
jgi:hypothetical protein